MSYPARVEKVRPPRTFKEDVVICAVEIEFVDILLKVASPVLINALIGCPLMLEIIDAPVERVNDLIVSAVRVDVYKL